ncbi:dienelactone hydrolase family protein [Bradyrhizobium sp. DN5]|uniref:dienelactone hydrolase family protein n=1 Tax=Bradyrhizobium sp. DN5 TaxID=3056950 RepID=UPI0035254DCB
MVARARPGQSGEVRDVSIPPSGLAGILHIPEGSRAVVVFAHGSGSSRFSPRNTAVAAALNHHALATLLLDLLTVDEEANRANVFNIELLADRLLDAVRWLDQDRTMARFAVGLFGSSTGAAAALMAAARLRNRIGAIVSRGGRPDLAGDAIDQVNAPTLFVIGGNDFGVIELNQDAFARLREPKAIEIVPGASHLFSEPGAIEQVTDHAARWFARYLTPMTPGAGSKAGQQHAVQR